MSPGGVIIIIDTTFTFTSIVFPAHLIPGQVQGGQSGPPLPHRLRRIHVRHNLERMVRVMVMVVVVVLVMVEVIMTCAI